MIKEGWHLIDGEEYEIEYIKRERIKAICIHQETELPRVVVNVEMKRFPNTYSEWEGYSFETINLLCCELAAMQGRYFSFFGE